MATEEETGAETFEEKYAREGRELEGRRIAHRRKLRQVCKALGDRFELQPYNKENGDWAALVSRRDPEAQINVWLPTRYKSEGKFEFRCERIKSRYPKISPYGYYDSRRDPKVNISAHRSPVSIARDLMRRFLPDFWRTRAERKASRDKHDRQHEAKVACGERIASVWEHGRDFSEQGRVYIWAKEVPGLYRCWVDDYTSEEDPGRLVTMELHGLTAEEALAIGDLLRASRGLAPLIVPPKPAPPRNSLWR